ncbi:MAG: bifunctional molybdenum cofactor biosynthesis protein MoaC/MoaB [Chitinophagaceae bacterium]
MVDILHKASSLRRAIAEATVHVSSPETITQIRERKVPKGDVLEFARAAGLFAVKKTADVIPDCHPLPIEYTHIRYELLEQAIRLEVEVATIYKTGVEVEAMHGASVVALTLYDMLKPIDTGIQIQNIQLLQKSGGKKSFKNTLNTPLKTAVIVCSDTIAAEKKEDRAGKAIIELLQQYQVNTTHYQIIPDEEAAIQEQVHQAVSNQFDLLIFCGGTGLSPRDITPEAVRPLIDREIPGIMEAARAYGQERTPYAMLSRGLAGFCQNTLVLTLPGSTQGAIESMQALFPHLLHIFKVAQGARHD